MSKGCSTVRLRSDGASSTKSSCVGESARSLKRRSCATPACVQATMQSCSPRPSKKIGGLNQQDRCASPASRSSNWRDSGRDSTCSDTDCGDSRVRKPTCTQLAKATGERQVNASQSLNTTRTPVEMATGFSPRVAVNVPQTKLTTPQKFERYFLGRGFAGPNVHSTSSGDL